MKETARHGAGGGGGAAGAVADAMANPSTGRMQAPRNQAMAIEAKVPMIVHQVSRRGGHLWMTPSAIRKKPPRHAAKLRTGHQGAVSAAAHEAMRHSAKFSAMAGPTRVALTKWSQNASQNANQNADHHEVRHAVQPREVRLEVLPGVRLEVRLEVRPEVRLEGPTGQRQVPKVLIAAQSRGRGQRNALRPPRHGPRKCRPSLSACSTAREDVS